MEDFSLVKISKLHVEGTRVPSRSFWGPRPRILGVCFAELMVTKQTTWAAVGVGQRVSVWRPAAWICQVLFLT